MGMKTRWGKGEEGAGKLCCAVVGLKTLGLLWISAIFASTEAFQDYSASERQFYSTL